MSSTYLQVKCKTWNRDSLSLFDYNSIHVSVQSFTVETSGAIMRKGNDLFYTTEIPTPTMGLLMNLYENDNEFIITPSKREKVGLVLQKTQFSSPKGYKLSVGNILKLGKVKLKVMAIDRIYEKAAEEVSEDEFEGSNAGDITCRICFRTHTNVIDPLLSICKCMGSMGLTHLKCLQKWLLSKALIKANVNCMSYCWRAVRCDICKEPLPETFSHENTIYELLAVPKPPTSSISLKDFRKNKYQYIIHVIYATNAPILLGRAADTDLKISDISVSRAHSSIEYSNGEFYIKDCKSKFGTIIMIKKPVLITEKKKVTLQAGRSIVTFQLITDSKLKKCIISCCQKNNKVEPIPFPRTRTEIVWEEISLNSSENNN